MGNKTKGGMLDWGSGFVQIDIHSNIQSIYVWYPRYVSFIIVRLYGLTFIVRLGGRVLRRITFILLDIGGERLWMGDREESFRGMSCLCSIG